MRQKITNSIGNWIIKGGCKDFIKFRDCPWALIMI